ncbi:MAG: hypothetical protein JEZ11_05035 [Desulfobacterales bacterium]|nr:hypothetical protein [Desulfobacterales bacterium]
MVAIGNGAELENLLANWTDSPQKIKKAFIRLLEHLQQKEGIALSFVARPGVTYSLRARHADQRKRELYAMVDVIDDDPADRWLSVCFYGDTITDPAENGDFVPEGLLGEDACCFDIEELNEPVMGYVEERLDEAHENAGKEG